MPRAKKLETEQTKKKKAANKELKEKRNKANYLLEDAKEEMLTKFSKKIPDEIEKRRNEFLKELEKQEIAQIDENGVSIQNGNMNVADFVDNAFSPIIKVAGKSPRYSADDIYMALDYFKECVKEINKYGLYIPTKEEFCNFLNLSTSRFNELKNGNDLEMREVCLQVEDYVASRVTQAGMTGSAEKLTAMYYQRAALGRIEPKEPDKQAPVVNNFFYSDKDARDLLKKYGDD